MTPNDLFNKNMKLVPYVISRYFSCFIGDEDIMQTGYLGLWKGCLTYNQDKAQPSSYLVICIRNEILIQLRIDNKDKQINCYESLDEPIVDSDGHETTKYDLYTGLPSYCNLGCMDKLKNTEKMVLKLLLDGHTQADIGNALNMTRSNVARIVKKIKPIVIDSIIEL